MHLRYTAICCALLVWSCRHCFNQASHCQKSNRPECNYKRKANWEIESDAIDQGRFIARIGGYRDTFCV